MKRCVVGVRRADAPIAKSLGRFAPTVWFPSMATMAAVLSEDNRAMLRLIHERKPKSLTELAELTGRQVPNLSRTLRMMEGYGLVTIEKNARETQPIAHWPRNFWLCWINRNHRTQPRPQ
ncbi:HVO_A0114 family putative DNA-binding protein [Nitrosomonas sp.]|uniref:HVO_A0114 family putative DNA-binding protein n=1 Tax=Nitrosomonas sp. TaxID=42353 RepID=UPI0025F1A6ED|nr:helix-turn-helix domain-containing protein [Nitrosomonas sp.]